MAGKSSASRELEIDLACVAWARRQKEREVRAALVASKRMKTNDALEKILLSADRDKKILARNRLIETEASRVVIFSDEDLYRLRIEEESERKKSESRLHGPLPQLRSVREITRGKAKATAPSKDEFFDKMESDRWHSPLRLK